MKTSARSALRIRLTIIFLVVLFLTLGSMWVNMVIKKTAMDASSEAQRTEPDYIVENFRYFNIKSTGEAQYEAVGTKMTHYPADDTYLIENPVLTTQNKNGQIETISSKEAFVEDFNSKVHMRENVVMKREATAGKGPLTLTSEYVLVFPDEEIMTSDREVVIKSDNSTVTGVGLHANNATREVQISNRARVTYNPPGAAKK